MCHHVQHGQNNPMFFFIFQWESPCWPVTWADDVSWQRTLGKLDLDDTFKEPQFAPSTIIRLGWRSMTSLKPFMHFTLYFKLMCAWLRVWQSKHTLTKPIWVGCRVWSGSITSKVQKTVSTNQQQQPCTGSRSTFYCCDFLRWVNVACFTPLYFAGRLTCYSLHPSPSWGISFSMSICCFSSWHFIYSN